MIGLSDELEEVKRILTGNWRDEIISYALVGTAGVGKTALAREVYHDPQVQSFFDCRVWIKVGREHYDFVNLAAQHRSCCQNCLIVLDDVWDDSGLLNFTRSAMGQKFHGSFRLLITARGPNAIKRAHDCVSGPVHKVLRFLTEEESKDLLCREVFGEGEACPTHLDKAVMKIAKNCEGLPLMILVVARHNRDLDYWIEVAEERNSVFPDSYEEISKVLFPSYDYLPQRLKTPFLFMRIYPRGYDIPISKVATMLIAQGWPLGPDNDTDLEEKVEHCLVELCNSYCLVLSKPKSSVCFTEHGVHKLKACRLHSSWRYLCRREARNNKFFHVLKKLVDAASSDSNGGEATIRGQRGLCLENNILFGLKQFCSSVESYCASSPRFLLFHGPYHGFPTPVEITSFKFLRELDALQLRSTLSQHTYSHCSNSSTLLSLATITSLERYPNSPNFEC